MDLDGRNRPGLIGDHDLHIRTITTDGTAPARLVLTGELDGGEVGTLNEAVASVLHSGPTAALHLDAGELAFLDSGGIRGLLIARKQTLHAGGQLSIVAVSPIVRQVLEITGLLGIFGIDEQAGSPDRFAETIDAG